jgi:hypothetical protein
MGALRANQPTRSRGSSDSPWHDQPEVELLLCLARAHLGPAEGRRVEVLLRGTLDWERFIHLAHQHRLVPLCARHLNRRGRDLVPRTALDAMHEYTEQNVRRSLLLTGELRTLLRLFDEAGIPAIAYKGPVLAQAVYGSVALRDMLDLDILVRKGDALRARQLLMDRGYRSSGPTDQCWDAYLLRSGCNFRLVHEPDGFLVELHWTPEVCISERQLEALWQRLEHVSLAGMQVPTFARQDLLLLLCLHGCRHMWERLEWLTAVAELLRGVDVAWDDVLRLASSFGARRALMLGVAMSNHLLGAPVPAEILRQARADSRTAGLLDAACRQLFSDAPILAHQLGFPFHDFQLCSKERLRDRVGYIVQRMTAPSMADWEAWRLPWSLFRMSCAVRRLRLLAAYTGWLWRRGAISASSGPMGGV